MDGELPDGFRIVVPAMGKIANFDDLDPLRSEPGVVLQFIRKGDLFPEKVDMVVLPGSKSISTWGIARKRMGSADHGVR